jgi:outer membrane protein
MTVLRHPYILALAAVIALAWPGGASAAETKVGFVNVAKVLESYKEVKTVEAKLKDMVEKKDAQLRPKQEEFNKLRQELETQASVLSAEALEDRKIELAKRQSNLEREVEAFREEVQIERRKLFSPLEKRIQDIISEIGKGEGFSMVIDTRQPGIIYWNNALDITDTVIERLNKKG